MSDKSEELEKRLGDEAELFGDCPAGLLFAEATAELKAQRDRLTQLVISEVEARTVRDKTLADLQYIKEALDADDIATHNPNLSTKTRVVVLRDIYRKAQADNERLRADTEEIFTAQAAEITRLREALRNCLSLVELKFGNTDPTGNAAIEQAKTALGEQDGS